MLDLATGISLTIAGFAALVAFVTYLRGNVREDKHAAEDRAETSTKLDIISNDIKDIKAENRRYSSELRDVHEIAVHARERADAAHERLDRAGIDSQGTRGGSND